MQNTLFSPLSYSVRFSVVAKYLGLMLLASLGVLFVPFCASLFWQEYDIAIRYSIIMLVFAGLGLPSLKITQPKVVQSNEAYVIIALTFMVGTLALSFPIMKNGLSFVDSWFETVSGLTTTGLSVIDLNKIEGKVFFFSRSWMQWYGGLGIVIFSLGLALRPGIISKSLVKKVASRDDLLESSKTFARKILIVYVAITLLAIIILKSVGFSLFDAINFSFASVSTGGFSSYPDSLGSFSYLGQSLIITFSFIGAISLPLFWISSFKDLKIMAKDRQLWMLIICCLVFATLITFLFSQNWTTFSPTALLNATSMQTTSGFSTFDISTLNNSTKFTMIASMLIGGSTQSTAGGLKLIRLFIILKALHLLFFRTSLSKHGNAKERFQDIQEEAYTCFNLFSLYVIAIFLSTFVFVIMGYDPLNSLFDVVSALGTVGVSSGLTGPDLPSLLKYVLIFDMFLGRLEIVTLLVLFYPKTLIGRRLKA